MTNSSTDHLMLSEIKLFQKIRSALEMYAVLLYKPVAMTVNKTDQDLFDTKHRTARLQL